MSNMDIHYDLTANELINEFTHGICGEDENGPIEKVSSAQLKDAIAATLAAERAAGRVEGEIAGLQSGRRIAGNRHRNFGADSLTEALDFHIEKTIDEFDREILSLRTADKTGDGT